MYEFIVVLNKFIRPYKIINILSEPTFRFLELSFENFYIIEIFYNLSSKVSIF